MSLNILALDLGTKTGFAVLKENAILSGTKILPSSKQHGVGVKFMEFRKWLLGILQNNDIKMIFFERVYAHRGTDAAHCYGGFLYHLASVCEEIGIKYKGIPVSTIKKFATGKGNASKEEMIAFAKSKGFNPIDDNEADALAILFAGVIMFYKSDGCERKKVLCGNLNTAGGKPSKLI